MRNVNIGGPLARRFNLPVVAMNDADCIALAIRHRAELQAVENLAVVMLGTGIGMGLILGGKLHSASSGAGAEFGHTKYQIDGPLCHCGRRGCIESFVGDYALYRDARSMLDLPNTDALHPSEEQMQALVELAESGHPVATSLFQQAGRALGYGLSNLIALIGPDLILITGSGVRGYGQMEAEMRRSLEEALVDTSAGPDRNPRLSLDRRPHHSRHRAAGPGRRPRSAHRRRWRAMSGRRRRDTDALSASSAWPQCPPHPQGVA